MYDKAQVVRIVADILQELNDEDIPEVIELTRERFKTLDVWTPITFMAFNCWKRVPKYMADKTPVIFNLVSQGTVTREGPHFPHSFEPMKIADGLFFRKENAGKNFLAEIHDKRYDVYDENKNLVKPYHLNKVFDTKEKAQEWIDEYFKKEGWRLL